MEKTQVSLNADGTETVSKVELPDDFFSQPTQPTPEQQLRADVDYLAAIGGITL